MNEIINAIQDKRINVRKDKDSYIFSRDSRVEVFFKGASEDCIKNLPSIEGKISESYYKEDKKNGTLFQDNK